MNNISKKSCFPSTRKVLDFDLNGQHMRKNEVPEGNRVLGCSPDHSTIRPCGAGFFGFHSLILSIVPIYIEHGCSERANFL